MQEALLAFQAARIVPETTKCLWRASLPTQTIAGHLLLHRRRYGFYGLDRINRERDGAVLPSHCRWKLLLSQDHADDLRTLAQRLAGGIRGGDL